MMTQTEKIAIVKSLTSDMNVGSNLIETYLTLADKRITARAYPFKKNATMPEEYEMLQCELASRMIARRGTEGQLSNSDNGIKRTYATVDDADLLAEVVQRVGVV